MPKFSYTRDLLLSLRGLDVCKNLPTAFDTSILSDLEDASASALEWQRTPGSSSQGPRHGEYVPASLKRVDGAGSYSRAGHGRWDTRSTGSSDKDVESHSDHDSQDSGGHFLNRSRQRWQNQERDGLLGSGAFLRPSGNQAGASGLKHRGNGHHQLNKCSERYQPPRPYKATAYSWRDSTDSHNEETFGSFECSSQERAEEERKRRASFESMRKEQQRALQNQKQTSDKHNDNVDNDIIALLEKSNTSKSLKNDSDDKLEENSSVLLPESDSVKYSFHGNPSASRPSVPPGFSNTIAEKSLGSQPSNRILMSEAGIMGKKPPSTRDAPVVDGVESAHHVVYDPGADVHCDGSVNKSKQIAGATEHQLTDLGHEDASISDGGLLGADGGLEDVISSNRQEVIFDRSQLDHSTSVFDKLFHNTAKYDKYDSSSTEGANVDEQTWAPTFGRSSKHTHSLSEPEKKNAGDLSSRDLLSLIINNREGTEASFPTQEHVQTGNEFSPPAATCSVSGIHMLHGHYSKLDADSGVLTCEDLEQSILAEAREGSSCLLPTTGEPLNLIDPNTELQKADVDDNASQHLMSLLNKGTCSADFSLPLSPILVQSSDRACGVNPNSEVPFMFTGNSSPRSVETFNGTEKSLTLEVLFGSAFMKELHSMEAPVSGHRGSISDCADTSEARNQMLFPNANHKVPSRELGLNSVLEENMTFKHTQGRRPQTYQESPMGNGAFKVQNSVHADNINEGPSEIQLPEEDNLIAVDDTVDPIASDPFLHGNVRRNVELLDARRPDQMLMDKLAASSTTGDDRYPINDLDAPSVCNSYHVVEPGFSHQHLHGRQPSPQQLSRPYMDYLRSPFQPPDGPVHGNPMMKFVGPENIHHNAPYQFPSVHHPFHGPGGPVPDPAIHLSMVSSMPMQGNFPQHQLLQGFPRGVPLSHMPNHMAHCMPEMNVMHGFSRQPNYRGFGMGMHGTGPGGPGGGDPAMLRRMMEMRTNLKQNHFSAHSLSERYSPELDMGFR